MFADHKDNNENLKDTIKNPLKDSLSLHVPYSGQGLSFSYYPKLNKLITALYMVTDIIDKEEPLRAKLRTLGVEILSDIHKSSRTEIADKVQTVLVLLDIALTIKLVSEMNLNILKKEFTELAESIDATREIHHTNDNWLEEFLKPKEALEQKEIHTIKHTQNIEESIHKNTHSVFTENTSFLIKKQRREDILKAIKDNGGSATITDVKIKATAELATCGEKTLQRELVAMVKDGILIKAGEKRWSRYSLVLP